MLSHLRRKPSRVRSAFLWAHVFGCRLQDIVELQESGKRKSDAGPVWDIHSVFSLGGACHELQGGTEQECDEEGRCDG